MAIVTEISWDDMLDGTLLPENPVRKAFREAVETVAEKGRTTLPALHGRIDKAVQLVLSGSVSFDADGQGKIASQSNGSVEYLVGKGDTCSCKDHPRALKNLCKHILAYHLYKRASALAKEQLKALDAPTNKSELITPPEVIPVESEPIALPLPLPEAKASANVYVTIAGRKVQLTLRDHDEDNLLSRMQKLLERFPSDEEPDPEANSTPPAEDWCSLHHVQMKERKGKYGPFYSHMTANGWCNGKKGK